MIEALIARAKAAGVTLSVKAGKLCLTGRPPDAALKADLVEHKALLIEYLTRPPQPVTPVPAPVPTVRPAPAPIPEIKHKWPAHSTRLPEAIRLNQRRRIMNDIRMGRRPPDDYSF